MPQNTNLNVSPYFDDFVDSKNYQKVLFKPGFPVQARELTTLQTILQNQVEKFGQHFFKEGSMIIPGGSSYDSEYNAVKIDHASVADDDFARFTSNGLEGRSSSEVLSDIGATTASAAADEATALAIALG